jgi:hypothetical protein
MPALVAGIHVFLAAFQRREAWMAGTSPAMTAQRSASTSPEFTLTTVFCSIQM